MPRSVTRALPVWAVGAALLLVLPACQSAGSAPPRAQQAMERATPEMAGVLDAQASLGPEPIEELTALEARQQPSVADGAKLYMQQHGMPTAPEPVASVRNISIPTAAGALPARVYKPEGAPKGRLPVVVYYHGGGFVIATVDTYDASARALANRTGAIVVAVEYRKAPENKFPAAHEDAFAAYKWVLQTAPQWGGDAGRVAVAGESAGGNLALGVSRAAHEQGVALPVHQLLVYPVAGVDMETPSYKENAKAKPLNKAMMGWFVDKYLASKDEMKNRYIDVVDSDLSFMPPTTIVNAEIDPLRSDGEILASRLHAAGVEVSQVTYPGVTHEFFGLGATVPEAKEAESYAGDRLKYALRK